MPETAYACMLCGMELPESGPVDWGNARFAASHVSCGAEYDRREHNDLCEFCGGPLADGSGRHIRGRYGTGRSHAGCSEYTGYPGGS